MSDGTDEHYQVYFKEQRIDPYRILLLYDITHPAHQHAVKKLLRIGRKQGQSIERDIDEVIMALNRWKEMIAEDESSPIKPLILKTCS